MLACHFLTLSTDNCAYRHTCMCTYMYLEGVITISKKIKNIVTKQNPTIIVSLFFPLILNIAGFIKDL